MKRLLSLALLGLLLTAVPASAYDYEPLTYHGFIDGSDDQSFVAAVRNL